MIDLTANNPKILVIGDLMIDHYLWGSCDRISPEAPVQVVNVDISDNTFQNNNWLQISLNFVDIHFQKPSIFLNLIP